MLRITVYATLIVILATGRFRSDGCSAVFTRHQWIWSYAHRTRKFRQKLGDQGGCHDQNQKAGYLPARHKVIIVRISHSSKPGIRLQVGAEHFFIA